MRFKEVLPFTLTTVNAKSKNVCTPGPFYNTVHYNTILDITLITRDVNECRNWYLNIRIGYSIIFEDSNYIHIYAQQTHYDDLLRGTCIENMRYMYMHGIVSGLYQWRHVRKSTNFAQKTSQSGGV